MDLSLFWILLSTVILRAWKVHGDLPVPVLYLEDNIIEDDDTEIRCTLPYSGKDAQLVIKMNNESLTGCDQRKGTYPNITCTVEVTRAMHEMEVTCEAQFKSQSKPEKMMLQTEPTFTDCPEEVVWIEGQETSFHCKANGYPPPTVTCGKKNSTIYKEGEIFTAEKTMSGNHTCKARNSDSVEKIVTVSVEYKPKILQINVTPPLHGEGDTVTLTCEADGLPDPTYSWSVPSSNVSFSSDNQTITVQSLQKSQLGDYKCTAHNRHGTATMEHVLDIAEKPKILNILAQPSLQVLEGDNVTLICEASGFPPPVFIWDLPKANVEYSKDLRTVKIWGVKKNHVGDYRCKAHNTHGVDTQTRQLTLAVKAKVVQIKVQPSGSVEEGTNVTLTCVAEGVPPPTFSWTPPASNVQYNNDNSRINIWGATQKHNGSYQCKVENKYGVDIQTKTILVKISAKGSQNSRGERRESVFAAILVTFISLSLFHYLC